MLLNQIPFVPVFEDDVFFTVMFSVFMLRAEDAICLKLF